MKLIVGLGNPGLKYLTTRHNIGFLLVDTFCKKKDFKNKFKGLIQKLTIKNQPVLFLKPQNYMNLSGESVSEALHFYKIPLEECLVIQDDVDQNFLDLKFQKNRGDGGHNGIKNIHTCLGTSDYARLKLGVGRSEFDNTSTSDHVLSSFSKKEMKELETFLKRAHHAVLHFIEKGFLDAANSYN